VTAYTFATPADENRAIELNNGINDPGTMVCTGHLFQRFIQDVETTKAWTWPVLVATIAQRAGCREETSHDHCRYRHPLPVEHVRHRQRRRV
jgi:hypothetical protein